MARALRIDDEDTLRRKLEEEIYPLNYDANYPNRFAPRASGQDVVNSVRPYTDRVLKPFDTNTDKIINEVQPYIEKGKKIYYDLWK